MNDTERKPVVVWVPVLVAALCGLWLFGQLRLGNALPATIAQTAFVFTALAQISCAWLFVPWAFRTGWESQLGDGCVSAVVLLPVYALCHQIGELDLLQLGLVQLGSVAAFTGHARLIDWFRRAISNAQIREVSLAVLQWAPILVLWSNGAHFGAAH